MSKVLREQQKLKRRRYCTVDLFIFFTQESRILICKMQNNNVSHFVLMKLSGPEEKCKTIPSFSILFQLGLRRKAN